MSNSPQQTVILANGQAFVIRSLSRGDRPGVSGMLSRSLPEPLYRRFMSCMREVPESYIDLLVTQDVPGACILVAAVEEQIVGHAMCATEDRQNAREAEGA